MNAGLRARRADRLGTSKQRPPGLVEGLSAGDERPGLPIEPVHQGSLGAQVSDEPVQPGHQRLPRLDVGESVAEPAQGIHLGHVHALDQCLTRRKVPVQGPDTNARPPCHFLERRLGAMLGEDGPAGSQESIEVPPGVDALGSLRCQEVGHCHVMSPFLPFANGGSLR